ncbi:MAG: rhodanese-related sulfurtransferase [Rhizobiaceae bacterium]
MTNETQIAVAALYRFTSVADPAALKHELAPFCCGRGIKGTLIVSGEGINGTVAGTPQAIADLLALLGEKPGFDGIDVKHSTASEMPFHRMKVRLKAEIVTMGVEGIDPLSDAGAYVEPQDWNALISDPATLVIDTRNDYEVALGTFAGAVDPETASFRDFPAWVDAHRDDLAGRKVAMFCTGGIRCEKATAYLRSLGLDDVYHLKGGILRYLEDVPAEQSLWQGECFVFDERVSVGHGLAEGDATLCRACRRPLTAADRASPFFAEGVSCPHCHAARSEADRARYAERHRQVTLAEVRGGKPHIGS